MVFVILHHKRLHVTLPILVGLGIFELMHTLGGVLMIQGVRLYDFAFGVIKFDNIVHAFASMVMLLLAYNILKPHLDHTINYKPAYLMMLLVLITLGIGAVVEMVEFSGVVFLDTPGVGGYFNNALDLVYNTVGAIVGFFFVHPYHKKQVTGRSRG